MASKLARFSIIAAIDSNSGISKEGTQPWQSKSVIKFFREKTIGNGRNAIILGRETYEALPDEIKPLPKRKNIVISRKWKQENHPDLMICNSFIQALSLLGNSSKGYDEILVIGGERIFETAISSYLYLCDKIYITKFKINFDCDQFFPWDSISSLPIGKNIVKTRDYTQYEFLPSVFHPEDIYKEFLSDTLENGETVSNSEALTNVFTFGKSFELFVDEKLMLFTCRSLSFSASVNRCLEWLQKPESACVLESLRRNEFSKIQFENVELHLCLTHDNKKLKCLVFLRECDIFAELPNLVCDIYLYCRCLCLCCAITLESLIFSFGKSYIQTKHKNAIHKVLSRTPRPLGKLSFRKAATIFNLNSFQENTFIAEDYDPWPMISYSGMKDL